MFVTTDTPSHLSTKGVVKPLPRSIIAPLPKVAIHALPAGILTWQHSPLAAGDYEIEDGIHDRSHLQCAWMSSWLCSRNQFFDTIPLTVGQISWIQLVFFHSPSVPPR